MKIYKILLSFLFLLVGLGVPGQVEASPDIQTNFSSFLELMAERYERQEPISRTEVESYFGEPTNEADGYLSYTFEDESRLFFNETPTGELQLEFARIVVESDATEESENHTVESFQNWVAEFLSQDLQAVDSVMTDNHLMYIQFTNIGPDGPMLTHIFPTWEVAQYWPSEEIYFYSFIPPKAFGDRKNFTDSDIETWQESIAKGEPMHLDELRALVGDHWVITYFLPSDNFKYEWFDEAYYLSATLAENDQVTHINYFKN